MTLAEPIAITIAVVRALDGLGIRYLVGSSLASSVHGIPRSTQDIDLLVELPGKLVESLAVELERDVIPTMAALGGHACVRRLARAEQFRG